MALPMKPCPERPELAELLAKSKAAYESMTPEQKREMHRAQRKSWVVGELMLEHPAMTRAEAVAAYDALELDQPSHPH